MKDKIFKELLESIEQAGKLRKERTNIMMILLPDGKILCERCYYKADTFNGRSIKTSQTCDICNKYGDE